MRDSIFISYRREDAAGQAGRLYDHLSAHFSRERVFMDVDRIEPGEDFVDAINRAVGSCRVLLVVIGKNWLASTVGEQRRLDNPHDYVRLEISAALERNIRTIPLLVQDARMPKAEELPAQLARLSRLNAHEISDGYRWGQDVQALIKFIDKEFFRQEDIEAKIEERVTPAGKSIPASNESTAATPMHQESSGRLFGKTFSTRRFKRPLVFGAAGLVLLVGVLGYLILTGRDARHEQPPEVLTSVDAAAVINVLKNQGKPIGVDVQDYKGDIDWQSVKNSGITFAYIKATDGDAFTDAKFLQNWEASKSAPILRGAYTVFRPAAGSVAQAEHFYKTVVAAQLAAGEIQLGELPPAIAVKGFPVDESSGEKLKELLHIVNQKFARVPVIYTSTEFWKAYKDSGDFSQYPLWISETNTLQPTSLPTGWSKWTFWQFSQSSQVPGIADLVDLNAFNGSQQELMAFSGK